MFDRHGALAAVGLAAALLGFAPTAKAQPEPPIPYRVTHDFGASYAPLPVGTDHTPVAYGSQPPWDEGAVRIPIGFEFDFFGRRVTEVWAYTNGFLAFQAPPSGATILTAPRRVPAAGDGIDGYIAPMWQDLDRDRASTPLPPPPILRSFTTGAPGSRTFTVEYRGFRRARSPQSEVNFQVVLSEASHRIRVAYGRNFGVLDATAAVEASSGAQGFSLFRSSPTCGGTCPCGPASCSSIPNFSSGLLIDVELPLAVDLVGAVAGPPGAAPGASFDAAVAVRNAGLLPAVPFDYELFLSPVAGSLQGATSLGRFRAPALSAVTTAVETRSLVVPAQTAVDTFFLAMQLDPDETVAEVDRANNLSFSPPFRTGPDLRGEVEAPAVAGPGERFEFVLTVENAGAPETRPFDVRAFLGTGTSRSPQDILLGTERLSLPNGFSRTATLAFVVPASIPTSPPPRRVLVELDSGLEIAEVNETNNLAVSPGTVRVVGPELIVSAVSSPARAARGRSTPVEITVENRGGSAARGARGCVLLRADSNFDLSADPRLIETTPVDIVAGATEILRLEAPVPAGQALGSAFLAGAIDCGQVVPVGDRAGTVRVRDGGPITIEAPAPALDIAAVFGPSRLQALGEAELRVRVVNRGSAPGGAELVLRAASGRAPNDQDPALDRQTVPPLEPAASAELRLSGSLPALNGPVVLSATVEPGGSTAATEPIALEDGPLAVVAEAPVPASLGEPYAWRFSATGPPVDAWRLEWTDPAPMGLAFDPQLGELSGTPTAVGSYRFSLVAASGALEAVRAFRLLVVPPGLELQIVTRRLPPALRGVSYEAQIEAVGGAPPYRFTLPRDIEEVPNGLSLDGDTGRMSGRPGIAGAYIVTLQVADRFGRSVQSPLAIDVLEPARPVLIRTAAVPAGVVGVPYETRFLAEGEASGALTWRIEGGAPGLRVNARTGAYSGVPTTAGRFGLVVEADAGAGQTDEKAFVVEIFDRGELVLTTGVELPEARLGLPYLEDGDTVALRAEPDDGQLEYAVVGGALPPGLVLGRTGALEGRPESLGVFAFVAQVQNGTGELRRGTFALRVRPAEDPPPISNGGCRGLGGSPAPWPPLALLVGLFLRTLRRTRGSHRAT